MKKEEYRGFELFRQKLFRIVSGGVSGDPGSAAYDVISIAALVINLTVTVLGTFDSLTQAYGGLFDKIEGATVFFFACDYLLRLFTSKYLYPQMSESRAMLR